MADQQQQHIVQEPESRLLSPASEPEAEERYEETSFTYEGPNRETVMNMRKAYLSKSQYYFYEDPVMLVKAKGQYCFDENGTKYLDLYSNVCHVGYSHPSITEAVTKQMNNIVSNTRYLHPNITEYARRLTSKLPGNLKICFFVNSGSEANDLAMRIARIYTGKKKVIVLDNAYHGTTASCSGVSPSMSTGSGRPSPDFAYQSQDVLIAAQPDSYRGKFRSSLHSDVGTKYAQDLETVISQARGNVAAYIHESIQGVAGQVIFPEGYLAKAYAKIRAAGGLCIADEVQVGFGRTGDHFWAFEHDDVIPDIVTMGKPIGNGFPLGCVVTTPEIAASFDDAQYFNTFGGNPVSCSVGLAVLDILEKENLQENAKEMGAYMQDQLQQLQKQYPIIGDVRGRGLFIGVELVQNPITLSPASQETTYVWERLRDLRVLVGKGGKYKNVLRIKPPIVVNKSDVDYFISQLEKILMELQDGSWKNMTLTQRIRARSMEVKKPRFSSKVLYNFAAVATLFGLARLFAK